MKLSTCILGKGERFPLESEAELLHLWNLPPEADDWGRTSSREGNGLWETGGAYTFNLFQVKTKRPLPKKKLNEAMYTTLSKQYIAGLLLPALPLASRLIDPTSRPLTKRVPAVCLPPGRASFPHLSRSAWPCTHLSNQDWRVLRLQWGWLSETIRPGDSSGSLPPLLHATSHLESISSVAVGRLTRGRGVLGEKQQVIGCVMCLGE